MNFRIRRIFDDLLPEDADALRQVQAILRTQFPDVRQRDVSQLSKKLRDPLSARFRSILFLAESAHHGVQGFALIMHAPDERFCFLDYIAAGSGRTSGGIGGALYARVREEALLLKSVGLFFECPPDDEVNCPEPDLRRQNGKRLRFYERFGARPLVDNEYQTKVKPSDTHLPLLVYDGLEPDRALPRAVAQRVVRALLERKYGDSCSPEYIQKVVQSFHADPVAQRPYRYHRDPPQVTPPNRDIPVDYRIAVTVSERHELHHIRERGYVESPVRIRTLQKEIDKLPFVTRLKSKRYPKRHIEAVHDHAFLQYLEHVCETIPEGKSVYPYVFPIRNPNRPPTDLATRAGYFCIDTFTPLHKNAWIAARDAVDCALTAADALSEGYRIAYALVRPPGHHAETRAFGGFCYLNSNAIAAQRLSARGRVAILDIDYHHGNGQQEIFYGRADVLTISIHGHPRFAYPYFTGFEDERGVDAGLGFNRNYPLPEQTTPEQYAATLDRALRRVAAFKPTTLIVALGLDTARGDPTGTWSLIAEHFESNGRRIGRLRLPTLVIQEGGYKTRTLGVNLRRFLSGLRSAHEDIE